MGDFDRDFRQPGFIGPDGRVANQGFRIETDDVEVPIITESQRIGFHQPFGNPPFVYVALSGLVLQDDVTRLNLHVFVTSVHEDHFTIAFHGNNQQHCSIRWFALGN